MLSNIGISEILLLGIIALLLFGPQKLPEIGRSVGRAIREFKQGANDLLNTDAPQSPPPARTDVTPPEAPAPEPAASAAPPLRPEQPAAPPQPADRRLPD